MRFVCNGRWAVLGVAIALLAALVNLGNHTTRGVAAPGAATPLPTREAVPSSGGGPGMGGRPEGSQDMSAPDDLFARPTMPANPTMADQGSQVYYEVCMACHGDQGQGLSPEWIAKWDLGEQSCWQSKCHAANHPVEGFELPKYIPPVVSPVIRARFANALELHDYIAAKMPWHAPGSLEAEQYWQVTAYLSRANGIDPGAGSLDETNAAMLSFKTASLPPAGAGAGAPGSASRGEGAGLGGYQAASLAAGGLIFFLLLVKWMDRRR